jgi:hypothetical protein
MLAILHAVQKWCPYLIGRHFKVKTDYDSLKYFLEKQLSSEEQKKWVTKMLGYEFEIVEVFTYTTSSYISSLL